MSNTPQNQPTLGMQPVVVTNAGGGAFPQSNTIGLATSRSSTQNTMFGGRNAMQTMASMPMTQTTNSMTMSTPGRSQLQMPSTFGTGAKQLPRQTQPNPMGRIPTTSSTSLTANTRRTSYSSSPMMPFPQTTRAKPMQRPIMQQSMPPHNSAVKSFPNKMTSPALSSQSLQTSTSALNQPYPTTLQRPMPGSTFQPSSMSMPLHVQSRQYTQTPMLSNSTPLGSQPSQHFTRVSNLGAPGMPQQKLRPFPTQVPVL